MQRRIQHLHLPAPTHLRLHPANPLERRQRRSAPAPITTPANRRDYQKHVGQILQRHTCHTDSDGKPTRTNLNLFTRITGIN